VVPYKDRTPGFVSNSLDPLHPLINVAHANYLEMGSLRSGSTIMTAKTLVRPWL